MLRERKQSNTNITIPYYEQDNLIYISYQKTNSLWYGIRISFSKDKNLKLSSVMFNYTRFKKKLI